MESPQHFFMALALCHADEVSLLDKYCEIFGENLGRTTRFLYANQGQKGLTAATAVANLFSQKTIVDQGNRDKNKNEIHYNFKHVDFGDVAREIGRTGSKTDQYFAFDNDDKKGSVVSIVKNPRLTKTEKWKMAKSGRLTKEESVARPYPFDVNNSRDLSFLSTVSDTKEQITYLTSLEKAVKTLNNSSLQNICRLMEELNHSTNIEQSIKNKLFDLICLANPLLVSPTMAFLPYANTFGMENVKLSVESELGEKIDVTTDNCDGIYYSSLHGNRFSKHSLFVYHIKGLLNSTSLASLNNPKAESFWGQFLQSFFILKYICSSLILAVGYELIYIDATSFSSIGNKKSTNSGLLTPDKILNETVERIDNLLSILKRLISNFRYYLTKRHLWEEEPGSVNDDIFEPLSIHVLNDAKLWLCQFSKTKDAEEFPMHYVSFLDSSIYGQVFLKMQQSNKRNKEQTTLDKEKEIVKVFSNRLSRYFNVFDITSCFCTLVSLHKNGNLSSDSASCWTFSRILQSKMTVKFDNIKNQEIFYARVIGAFIVNPAVPLPRNVVSHIMNLKSDGTTFKHDAKYFFQSFTFTEFKTNNGTLLLASNNLKYLVYYLLFFPRTFLLNQQEGNQSSKLEISVTNAMNTAKTKESGDTDARKTIWEVLSEAWTVHNIENSRDNLKDEFSQLLKKVISPFLLQARVSTEKFSSPKIPESVQLLLRDVIYKSLSFLYPRMAFITENESRPKLPPFLTQTLFKFDNSIHFISVTSGVFRLSHIIASLRSPHYLKHIIGATDSKKAKLHYLSLNKTGDFSSVRDDVIWEFANDSLVEDFEQDSYNVVLRTNKGDSNPVEHEFKFSLNSPFMARVILFLQERMKHILVDRKGFTKLGGRHESYWTISKESELDKSEALLTNYPVVGEYCIKRTGGPGEQLFLQYNGDKELNTDSIHSMFDTLGYIKNGWIVLYDVSTNLSDKDFQQVVYKGDRMRNLMELNRATTLLKFDEFVKLNDKNMTEKDESLPFLIDTMPHIKQSLQTELLYRKNSREIRDFFEPPLSTVIETNSIIPVIKICLPLAGNGIDSGSKRPSIFNIRTETDLSPTEGEKKAWRISLKNSKMSKLSGNREQGTEPESVEDRQLNTEASFKIKLVGQPASVHINITKENIPISPDKVWDTMMFSMMVTDKNLTGFYESLQRKAKEYFPENRKLIPLKYLSLVTNETFEFDPVTVAQTVFQEGDKKNSLIRIFLYDEVNTRLLQEGTKTIVIDK